MSGSVHFQNNRYFVSVYWDSKRYKIRKYNGEPIWHERTAAKLLSIIQGEIDDGTFLPKSYLPDSPVAIGPYAAQWIKSLSVSPATLKFYKKEIKHAVDYFGTDADIRKFTFSKLQTFYNELPLTIKGKYHVLNTLKTMLRFAYQDELIGKMPPFPKLTQGAQQEIKYLSYEQQQTIISNIPEQDRSIFEFAMEYGLRIGEVIALQKDCISDDEVTIKRAMSEGELRNATKTGKIRRYGLTSKAKEILSRQPLSLSPFVFNQKNGKPYTWKVLTLRWRSACKTSGIDINLYNGIRHSLGCQLMDEGVEMEMVRDILGHTTTTMTRRYAQRSKTSMTNVLEFRSGLFGTAIQKKNSN